MVNGDGQLYTIEGIAAALILLITAFIVVNSTSVYTPGDAHISDMQLEVLGSDALRMMDTAPNSTIGKSPLQTMVENNDGNAFRTRFSGIINNRTLSAADRIQFTANVTCVGSDGKTVNSSSLSTSAQPLVGLEHSVRVSEWMIVDKRPYPWCGDSTKKHAVIVEVLLWRD